MELWQTNGLYLDAMAAALRFNIPPRRACHVINWAVAHLRMRTMVLTTGDNPTIWRVMKRVVQCYSVWVLLPVVAVCGWPVAEGIADIFGGAGYYREQFYRGDKYSLVELFSKIAGLPGWEAFILLLEETKRRYFAIPTVEEVSWVRRGKRCGLRR